MRLGAGGRWEIMLILKRATPWADSRSDRRVTHNARVVTLCRLCTPFTFEVSAQLEIDELMSAADDERFRRAVRCRPLRVGTLNANGNFSEPDDCAASVTSLRRSGSAATSGCNHKKRSSPGPYRGNQTVLEHLARDKTETRVRVCFATPNETPVVRSYPEPNLERRPRAAERVVLFPHGAVYRNKGGPNEQRICCSHGPRTDRR